MMSSRFTSNEMGHNPQAPGPAKEQAHSCWRKNHGRSVDFINTRSYRSLRKTWEMWRNDRCFVWLAKSMDLFELGSSTREILQCLREWPSVRLRDLLKHVQGNDFGAGWIDHHTNLLLLFALLYGMVNLSDLTIVERRRSKPCLNLRMVWQFSLVQRSCCQS